MAGQDNERQGVVRRAIQADDAERERVVDILGDWLEGSDRLAIDALRAVLDAGYVITPRNAPGTVDTMGT